MAKHFITFFSLLLGLIIPGASFSRTDQKHLALLPTFIGLLWVLLLSWQRFVCTQTGFYSMLIGLFVIHAFSYIWASYLIIYKRPKLNAIQTLLTLGAATLLFLSVCIACHQNKSDWFGFAFYQIPSASMEPSLQIGDVILVDTWQYKAIAPAINDIVVFQQTAESTDVLVKRITGVKQGRIFVEGDNELRSVDSRSFGWVDADLLIGRFGFVWFNLLGAK